MTDYDKLISEKWYGLLIIWFELILTKLKFYRKQR